MSPRAARIAAASVLAIHLLGGCASARRGTSSVGPHDTQALVPGAEEVAALASLIRLEDRREYDSVAIAGFARSASALVRRHAALSAGRIGDGHAVPLLTGMLADADTGTAANAAFALGMLADSAAVPALAALLDPASVSVRPTVIGAAASALGRIPTAASRAAVEGFLRRVPVDGANVDAVGPALLAFWRYPRPADPTPVLPWLASRDPELRGRAAYALTRRPDPRAASALLPLATDPDALVRSFAVRSLGAALADSAGIAHPAAIGILVRAVDDSALAVRVNATRTLSGYGEPASVDALRRVLLRSADPHPAVTAAEALGRLGAKAAAATADLRTVAMDARAPIGLRTAALAALVTVSPSTAKEVAAIASTDQSWRMRAAAGQAFAALAADGRAGMQALARDADPRVAASVLGAAVEAAGKDPAPLRALLIESLGHADVQVRANAANGLAALADPSTLPLLLDAYARAARDTVNDAALAAVDALGALKPSRDAAARAFLARFPRAADELVRHHVRAAFGDTLAAAWGPVHPVETGRDAESYARLVRETVVPSLGGRSPRVRFVTSRGEFEAELFGDDAPLTVESFLRLVRARYFDGQDWPRVVANFVIQGGDPRGDTSGGPGYAIRDEINRDPYLRGTLGMALSGPDTGGSQFFVAHSPQPHLDGGYTVFGRVVKGMDVVDGILQGDRILRIEEIR
ncbi:MAG: Peptidyl-prolyl cis-trans isomerase (rotamase) - cyclophilin family [Gemmatimonadetes bacterium]|nr:Peptidyl-prolyl cis-trans isomerase (rotamase) - cyclophilin family [Gemmatimonadota bacterium]